MAGAGLCGRDAQRHDTCPAAGQLALRAQWAGAHGAGHPHGGAGVTAPFAPDRGR